MRRRIKCQSTPDVPNGQNPQYEHSLKASEIYGGLRFVNISVYDKQVKGKFIGKPFLNDGEWLAKAIFSGSHKRRIIHLSDYGITKSSSKNSWCSRCITIHKTPKDMERYGRWSRSRRGRMVLSVMKFEYESEISEQSRDLTEEE